MLFTPRQKGLGKDNFLKLNDQEEVQGVFAGALYTFKRHWKNNQSMECIGSSCPVCTTDPENRPGFRFRVNFITTKDGKWVAKIFEGGGELYDSLVGLDKKFNLSDTVVEIIRRGTKQNTKYDVLPRADMPINKEMKEKIGAVSLLPLKHEPMEQKTA